MSLPSVRANAQFLTSESLLGSVGPMGQYYIGAIWGFIRECMQKDPTPSPHVHHERFLSFGRLGNTRDFVRV